MVSKEEGWVLSVTAVPPYGPDRAGGQPKPIPGPSFGLQVVYVPAPKYTDAAKANKIQGSVFVIATFRADGTVADPQVVKGIGYGLDEEALNVVRHVKFVPARVEGKPIDVTRTMRVPFVLQ